MHQQCAVIPIAQATFHCKYARLPPFSVFAYFMVFTSVASLPCSQPAPGWHKWVGRVSSLPLQESHIVWFNYFPNSRQSLAKP